MRFVSIRPPNVAQPLQIFFHPIEIRLLTALEWPSFFSRRIVDIEVLVQCYLCLQIVYLLIPIITFHFDRYYYFRQMEECTKNCKKIPIAIVSLSIIIQNSSVHRSSSRSIHYAIDGCRGFESIKDEGKKHGWREEGRVVHKTFMLKSLSYIQPRRLEPFNYEF